MTTTTVEVLQPTIRFRPHPVKRIQTIVSERYHVSMVDLLGPRRTGYVAKARHIAIYVAKLETGISNCEIGRRFCRDHSTVHYAVHRMDSLVAADTALAIEIQVVRVLFANGEVSNANLR